MPSAAVPLWRDGRRAGPGTGTGCNAPAPDFQGEGAWRRLDAERHDEALGRRNGGLLAERNEPGAVLDDVVGRQHDDDRVGPLRGGDPRPESRRIGSSTMSALAPICSS